MNPQRLIPENYNPPRQTMMRLHKEFGADVDLVLSLRRFRLYYSEGQVSRNWDAKFEAWLIGDAQRVRDRLKGGTDDLGVPITQRPKYETALQPGDPGYTTIEQLADDARGRSNP